MNEKIVISDKEKLEKILPYPAQSHAIDGLFKEYVDLREFIAPLKDNLKNPVKILNTDKPLRDVFFHGLG